MSTRIQPSREEAWASRYLASHEPTVKEPPLLTPEFILTHVAIAAGLEPRQILGAGRDEEVSRARSMAMFLSREMTNASYSRIAETFAKRDRTTVMSACSKVRERCSDDVFGHRVAKLQAMILRSYEAFCDDEMQQLSFPSHATGSVKPMRMGIGITP